MKKTRRSPKQGITKLRKVKTVRAKARTVAGAVRDIGVIEQTYYQWRRRSGGRDRGQLKQLENLEKQNAWSKNLVAGLFSFDMNILKAVLEGAVAVRRVQKDRTSVFISWVKTLEERFGKLGRRPARLSFLLCGRPYLFRQKAGREEAIPLGWKATSLLASMGQGPPESYVFLPPRSPRSARNEQSFATRLSKAFTRYRRAASIQREVTFHGLRHGLCTTLAEAGASGPIIQAAARHREPSTSMKYVQLSGNFLRQQLDEAFGI